MSLTIKKLADAAGVGIDTVRYYERAGLLPEPPRRASGYREYPDDMIARLRFIRRAKELGFTLDEIQELLSLSAQRDHGVRGVKAAAQVKLELVDRKIAELRRVRAGLAKLIDACPGHGPLGECPIIKALSSGERT